MYQPTLDRGAPASPPTTGSRLELQRLEHRERQVERVLTMLQRRVEFRVSTSGRAPLPLEWAVQGLAGELATVRDRMAQMRSGSARRGR